MTTEKPLERVKLDYYALGKVEKNPEIHVFNNNKGTKDTSNNILERNCLSVNSSNLNSLRENFKTMSTVYSQKLDTNNYMDPLKNYSSNEKYTIRPDMTNRETYNITKSKYFANDRAMILNTGMSLSKDEFSKRKNYLTDSFPKITENSNFNNEKIKTLTETELYFMKNDKGMVRYPKGYWKYNAE
jgi:hypothetical protein